MWRCSSRPRSTTAEGCCAASRYLRRYGPWSIFLEQHEIGAKLPDWIDRWDGDGIITHYDDPQILETGLPTVVLFDRTDEWLGLPRILNDNFAIGRMAAQHLLRAGVPIFRLLRHARRILVGFTLAGRAGRGQGLGG